VLENGQEIAVKKLSLESRQGVREFLNEVRLLLKVQHRNLVSLLGCCASSGHKMLVYPYFPNGSLDHFLFGDTSLPSAYYRIMLQNVFIVFFLGEQNVFIVNCHQIASELRVEFVS
jgi:serine/threonine protein kinase